MQGLYTLRLPSGAAISFPKSGDRGREISACADLICILQMMPTIAEDYLGMRWKHFLLSPKRLNRNIDNLASRFHLTRWTRGRSGN
jgi:hypothetical protein